jgi:hypothetical protein
MANHWSVAQEEKKKCDLQQTVATSSLRGFFLFPSLYLSANRWEAPSSAIVWY